MSRSEAVRARQFLAGGKDYHRLLLDHWLPAAGIVADVGCGYGRITNVYDRPGRRVVGFELNQSDLLAARAVDGKPFVAADAAALPLPDSSVNAYVGLGLVEVVPDGAAVLREAHRVLVDGGLIYLTVPYLNRRRTHTGTAAWRGMTVPAFTAKSASALLAPAGFTVVATRPSSLAWGFGKFGRVASRVLPSVIGREDDRRATYRLLAPLLRPYANSLLIIGKKGA